MAVAVPARVTVPSRHAYSSLYPMNIRLGIEENEATDKSDSLIAPAAKNHCENFRAHVPLVARRKLTWPTRDERASLAFKFRTKPNNALFAFYLPLGTVHDRRGIAFGIAINDFTIYVIFIVAILIIPSYLAGQHPSIREGEGGQEIFWFPN